MGQSDRMSSDGHPKDLCECGHRRANHRTSGFLEGSCSVNIREFVGRTAKKGDVQQYFDGCQCVGFVLSQVHDERNA
jgi:hypothetical protein